MRPASLMDRRGAPAGTVSSSHEQMGAPFRDQPAAHSAQRASNGGPGRQLVPLTTTSSQFASSVLTWKYAVLPASWSE